MEYRHTTKCHVHGTLHLHTFIPHRLFVRNSSSYYCYTDNWKPTIETKVKLNTILKIGCDVIGLPPRQRTCMCITVTCQHANMLTDTYFCVALSIAPIMVITFSNIEMDRQ